MDLLAAVEKLINERASAAVMRDHLAFFRDQVKLLEGENGTLKKRVAELEKLTADLAAQLAAKRPKTRVQSGELEVDGILWNYVANEATGKWVRFEALCPHCRTALRVEDTSDMFVLEDRNRRVRYHCDYEPCGKFDKTFAGLASGREEKAARHINRKHLEINPG